MSRYRDLSPMSDDTDELYTDLNYVGAKLNSILNSSLSHQKSVDKMSAADIRHTYDYDTKGRSTVNVLSSPSHSTSSSVCSLPASPVRSLGSPMRSLGTSSRSLGSPVR